MADPVNAATIELIKRNEGCVLHAYQDVVGVWTIGYGHTPAEPGQQITQDQADSLLAADLGKFEDGVDDALEENAETSDNQFGAMVSLAYNIGLGAFRGSSVLRLHNQGQWEDAAHSFLLWNKAGGRVLTALLRRRHEEAALYLTPDPV